MCHYSQPKEGKQVTREDVHLASDCLARSATVKDAAQQVASHSPDRALLPRELKLNWEANYVPGESALTFFINVTGIIHPA